MQMRMLRGKNIVSAGYDPVTATLRVRFPKSQYEYEGVPEAKFVSLCRSPFPDGYFTKVIKGVFKSTKIEDPPPEPPRPAQKASSSMEVYFTADGMAFHEKDANGNPAHFYTLKDQRVPFSLTQILELSGLARQPATEQERQAWDLKAEFGTKVHTYSLYLDQGEMDLEQLDKYPRYQNCVKGWQQFREDFHFQPDMTMCEVPVGVRVNGMLYATKVDAYGCIGEGDTLCMAVCEKKCTCNIEPHFALQTAGEALAFKMHAESLNMPLKRFVVQLLEAPNGSGRCYKAVENTDRNDERTFVSAGLLNVYTRLNYGTLKVD